MTGDILKDSAEIFANIQEKAPVVHNISNYITATDWCQYDIGVWRVSNDGR